MGDVKGLSLVILRQIMAEKGLEVEQGLLAQLTPPEAQAYQTTLASNWVPIEVFSKILSAAADVCFPTEFARLRQLGYVIGGRQLRGVYKVFARFASIAQIMGQTAKIWGTFHKSGRATTKKLSDRSMEFTVEDYPDLPMEFRRYLTGWMQGLGEVSGQKNLRISLVESQTEPWRWVVVWD